MTTWASARTAIRGGYASIAFAAAGLAVLAACSSSGNSNSSQNSTAPPATSGALATRDVSGVGTVLVDATGKTLYTSEQEASGAVKCTGDCLQFWFPVNGSASATAPNGVTGTIATVTRSDTQTQLTYNGAPLYTFAQDKAPGDAKGNGFSDAFGSDHFTWHAVIITPAPGASSTSNSGGGY